MRWLQKAHPPSSGSPAVRVITTLVCLCLPLCCLGGTAGRVLQHGRTYFLNLQTVIGA